MLEIETKLQLPDGFDAAQILRDPWLLDLIDTPFVETQHRAIYYDTADGLLAQRKWALRVRREGDVYRVALKTGTENIDIRNEWQCEATEIAGALPKLAALGAPAEGLQVEELLPICEINFTRTHGVIILGVLSAELAIDIGEIIIGTKFAPICELELELLSGDVTKLQALTGIFIARYGLARQPLSKLERALSIRNE
ncbi:MAG: CYTH domain-containing protein [Oscillospiraceae bacterium]|nr:CYTH domain-containing protein [Oscillospiraceae bacterium]